MSHKINQRFSTLLPSATLCLVSLEASNNTWREYCYPLINALTDMGGTFSLSSQEKKLPHCLLDQTNMGKQ